GANEIKESCTKGTIGCSACKQLLSQNIVDLLGPMQERRREYVDHPKRVDEILLAGTQRARAIAKETMREVREAMQINYFDGD
ncbi:MAG: tryptophan--tRNA ligase, partial [Bacilli bacterium]|nr:tryptophan--tRNA ligase [Bacilli bacterium]